MMKKLFALALVLSVASLASAGLQWVSSTGTFDVNPGEIITLTLDATDGDKASAVNIGLITDNGALGGFDAWSFNAGFTTVGSAGVTGETFNGMAGTAFAADDIAWLDALSTEDAFSSGLLTLTYRVGAEAAGTVITISGAGNSMTMQGNNIGLLSGGQGMPEVALNVVPEPATMALLGLGALVLRRRK